MMVLLCHSSECGCFVCFACLRSGDFPCYFLFGCKERGGAALRQAGAMHSGTPGHLRRRSLFAGGVTGGVQSSRIFLVIFCTCMARSEGTTRCFRGG